jgi:hypothetical protein
MGAWGFGPLDSDQALDWLGDVVTDHAGTFIAALLRDFHRDRQIHGLDDAVHAHALHLRAAAHVVTSLNFFSNERRYGDLFQQLYDALTLVLDCKEWLESWTEPDKVASSIQDQLVQLRGGMRSTGLFDQLDTEQGIQVNLGVAVAPEHRTAFLALLQDKSETSLMHDIEKIIGLHLMGITGSALPFNSTVDVEHGEGVATVFQSDI